jgi:cyclic pyranopterin monophosphate synthase
MKKLSHLNARGEARMVDVSAKPAVRREAIARGEIRMAAATVQAIEKDQIAKGNVLATARLAGIMAAKRTGELIPLCHPLPIEHVELNLEVTDERTIRIEAVVEVHGRTGVEMEALTAVSVAALAIYDMCKSADRGILIGPIGLVEKSGGKSGDFRRTLPRYSYES